ncbi:MAG: ADP-forming succinate--CoA ligase subunit beta [Gammaproteobacteria bacterium]|nr:ADP-forming succinate--CoA ligase subunit beta [Gammaproteobacteria bacterium]
MHLHEYQAKALLHLYGVTVPEAEVIDSAAQVVDATQRLGGKSWVVKAQIHAGGRGKAGAVKHVASVNEAQAMAQQLIGRSLLTAQTGPAGNPVQRLLIERPLIIQRELYVSLLVDRERQRVLIMASSHGGMDIEAVASQTPEKIFNVFIDPVVGLQAYQCRQLAYALSLAEQIKSFSAILQGLYRLFIDKDLRLLEINPLVLTPTGLLAADAKIDCDDNGLYRHADLVALRDRSQEDSKEAAADEHGLNYVSLDGDIACMVNGAGLAMATMDIIKLYGGAPANFLDVGGGTTAAKVAEAFKIIVADAKVKAILVNIFGGIVRCDLIAQGIIDAVKQVSVRVPVVVRLEGTNALAGRELLAHSGVAIIAATDLADAAQKAVQARGGR